MNTSIFDTEMTRKQFIMWAVGAIVILSGVPAITTKVQSALGNKSSQKVNGAGFGNGPYGS